jgi:hypothetical protein
MSAICLYSGWDFSVFAAALLARMTASLLCCGKCPNILQGFDAGWGAAQCAHEPFHPNNPQRPLS